MKLGSQTGSLINHVYSREKSPEPVVGMGATILGWSDRHAGTIVNVFDVRGVKHISVQRDISKRIDKNGMSDSQTYEYSPNTQGPVNTFRFRNDRWEEVYFNTKTNRWNKFGSYGIRIDVRDTHHDYSF